MAGKIILVWMVLAVVLFANWTCLAQSKGLATWRGGWQISPTTASAWSVQTRIPRSEYNESINMALN